MSDYLSHIATRSSGVALDNAVAPQGLLNYTTDSMSDDIAVEAAETVAETRAQALTATQNTLNRPTTPKAAAKQEQTFNTPPQYLNKHIERLSIENIVKPVFYDRLDTQIHQKLETPVKDNHFWTDPSIVQHEQKKQRVHKPYLNVQPEKQIFGHQPTQIQATDEKGNPIERKRNILTPNTDGTSRNSREGGQNENILEKHSVPKHLKPSLQRESVANERVKLQPSMLNLETPMVKKATATPKLVIGRITVEVLPPPVAPLIKTIVRTVERGGGASTNSDNTIHKLSFGLGQL